MGASSPENGNAKRELPGETERVRYREKVGQSLGRVGANHDRDEMGGSLLFGGWPMA